MLIQKGTQRLQPVYTERYDAGQEQGDGGGRYPLQQETLT